MHNYGFIHDELDLKILILYVLKRLPEAVDASMLFDLVYVDNGINYFSFVKCLNDLVSTDHIESPQEGYYRITKKGLQNAASVESSLPATARRDAGANADRIAARMRRASLITAGHQWEAAKKAFEMKLTMSDGENEIISLKLEMPNEEQCKKMERTFRLHAETIYDQILNLLSSEDTNQEK